MPRRSLNYQFMEILNFKACGWTSFSSLSNSCNFCRRWGFIDTIRLSRTFIFALNNLRKSYFYMNYNELWIPIPHQLHLRHLHNNNNNKSYFRDVIAQFKLVKQKFVNLILLHVNLGNFQITQGLKECMTCQRTNYYTTTNYSGYIEPLLSHDICAVN